MNETSLRSFNHLHSSISWPIGAMAGFAGGAIEVGWIATYQNLAGQEGAAVARGVTQSIFPNFANITAAVPLGIVIHMALAMLLGILVAISLKLFVPRVVGTVMEPIVVVGMLAAVWSVNFFLILPAINPEFGFLLPHGVSLISKILFGFAAAFVFWISHRLCAVRDQ